MCFHLTEIAASEQGATVGNMRSEEKKAARELERVSELPDARPDSAATSNLTKVSETHAEFDTVTASSPSATKLQARLRVDFTDLMFYELIGKGSFKAVYRGKWADTHVAIVCMRKVIRTGVPCCRL